MVAILHETATFILKSMLLGKQSSLLQTKYSKLHPNKSLNAVHCSANTRAKSGPYNCSCTICQWWSQWEHSWLRTLPRGPATHILLNSILSTLFLIFLSSLNFGMIKILLLFLQFAYIEPFNSTQVFQELYSSIFIHTSYGLR